MAYGCYDDVDILPSSSLFDKSYPEFYGDQCLSKQFLWNFLLEVVKPVSILDLKIWLNLFVDKMALVGACRKTRHQNKTIFFVKSKNWITFFRKIFQGKFIYKKWSGKSQKQIIFNKSQLDCPMSQHMSRHQNTTKNIQQTTHVMTLNATYDIGQFDIKEFKILKKISFHIFFSFFPS